MRRRKKTKGYLWVVLLAACAVLMGTGGLLARYVSANRRQYEMVSAQFHISSDYLDANNTTYTVADWSGGVDVTLYNYEKENLAQIAASDITYQVSVENGTCEVADQDGAAVAADDSDSKTYKLGGDGTTRKSQSLHLTPATDSSGAAQTMKVTVTTTAPFQKTLSATFQFGTGSQPTYHWETRGDGNSVLLTISTNDYSGEISVQWNAAELSPDNTNKLMRDWKNADQSGAFTAAANTTYELIFVKKNTGDTITANSGSGTTIILGTNQGGGTTT